MSQMLPFQLLVIVVGLIPAATGQSFTMNRMTKEEHNVLDSEMSI